MALQNTVNLRMTKQVPGAQVSGGNARTTRTASWQGETATELFGKIVARGAQSDMVRALSSTDTLKNIFGIALDDKLQQNAAGNNGSTSIDEGYPLLVGTYGGFTVQHLGDIDPTADIYAVSSDAAAPENVGLLTNDNTAGDTRILVGGPSFTGVSIIQAYESATGGSTVPIEVQISNI